MPDFGFSAASLQSSDKFAPYSKVILKTDDYDSSQVKTFTAGDDSGRTLEAVLPWASQDVANSILGSIIGYAYQPITAKGVIVDPATELGDDITVGGVSGYIENQDITFGGILRADIAAPGEEQIDHEYQFIVKRDRKYARDMSAVGGGIRANREAIRQASVSLAADIGDVRAGLHAIATADDIKGFKEAKTTLFAKIQDDKQALQAGIDARVTSKEFGEYKEAVVNTYATIDNVNAGLLSKASVQYVDNTFYTKTAANELVSQVGIIQSGLNTLAQESLSKDEAGRIYLTQTAAAGLYATVEDVNSTLELKAEKTTVTALDGRVSTVENSTASLVARVGSAEASLELKAEQSTVNSLSQSVATLSADVVNLKGRVDLTGSLSVSGGNVYASGDITALTGTIVANTIAASSEFLIGGTQYVPTQITSTTGAVTVLGCA